MSECRYPARLAPQRHERMRPPRRPILRTGLAPSATFAAMFVGRTGMASLRCADALCSARLFGVNAPRSMAHRLRRSMSRKALVVSDNEICRQRGSAALWALDRWPESADDETVRLAIRRA